MDPTIIYAKGYWSLWENDDGPQGIIASLEWFKESDMEV